MSTAVFENIVGTNFGGSDSPKMSSNAKKTESSEFRDLVKDKSSTNTNTNTHTQSNESNLKTETVPSRKESDLRDNTSQTTQGIEKVESPETIVSDEFVGVEESLILPVFVDELISDETEVVLVEENFADEGLESFEEPIVPVNIDVEREVETFDVKLETEVTVDSFKEESVLNQSAFIQADADNIVLVDTITPKQEQVLDIEESTVVISLNLTELSAEEQAMHQNLKTLTLPQKSESYISTSEVDLIESAPVILADSDEGVKKLDELIKKLDAPVKVQVETIPRSSSETKPVVIPSLNLSLADTTRHGSAVISKMQIADDTNKTENAVTLGMDDLSIDAETLLADLGNKNDKSSSSSLPLSAFGGAMQQTSDEAFNISFKGQNIASSQHEMPKPAMQVSLAVNEVLNSSSSAGKKQITINLHPQTLGAIKVEILSQIGHDGASKIENIKISADKHATLIMLEERKADLASSLKEVTSTKEEASLQFEMSQDQGKGRAAYFESLEERNSWMSQFVGLIADDEAQMVPVVDEYATRGIATEDKIDLVA